MRWCVWWQVLMALYARSLAQPATPTICEDEACHCDSFTRVICTCTRTYSEVILRPDGSYRVPTTATRIVINGCDSVHFLPDTVRNLIRLQSVEIRNAKHINIDERSIAWPPFSTENEMMPGIKIIIENSTVNEIASHAISGRVNDILIYNSKIKTLKPFAFSSLTDVKNIELKGNTFDNIEIQAFKKFTTWNFSIRGGSAKTLPSRFLSDVEVNNLFELDSVTIDYLNSLTFLINSPKRVIVKNSIFETLEGDAFHITTRGSIMFKNNTIRNLKKGAFYGFAVDRETISMLGAQELLIDNNTIGNIAPSSLIYNRSSLIMRVDYLNVNTSCTCNLATEWREISREQGGTIYCWYALENHYISTTSYVNSRCGAFKQNFWILVVIGIVLVAILAAIVTFIVVRREKENNKKVQIVMPDGKTYRETELHIVVERAELLTTDL